MKLRIHSHFWYLYLGFCIIMVLIDALSLWFSVEANESVRVFIDLGIDIAAILGLIGFIRSTPILTPSVWRAFFVLYVVYFSWDMFDSLHFLYFNPDSWAGWSGLEITGLAFAALMLILPMICALYVYSFRSSKVWRTGG